MHVLAHKCQENIVGKGENAGILSFSYYVFNPFPNEKF